MLAISIEMCYYNRGGNKRVPQKRGEKKMFRTTNTLITITTWDDGETLNNQFVIENDDIDEVAIMVYEIVTDYNDFRWFVPNELYDVDDINDLDYAIATIHENKMDTLNGLDLIEYISENSNIEIEVGEITCFTR